MPSIASRTVGTSILDDTPAEGRPGAPAQALAAPVASSGTVITRGLLPAQNMIPGQAPLQFAGNMGPVPTQYMWPIIPVSPVVQKAKLTTTPQQSTPAPPVQDGQPHQVVSISAASEPYKTSDGVVKCAVTISFVPYPYDPNFSNCRIWFEGYHGSQTPQLMAEGPTSPVSFLADPTGENVTVYAEAISNQGVTSKGPVTAYAPKDTIDLASTVGIPPTPSLAQTLRGTPTGYQFAFNQLAGLAANVIDGYAIYRNTTDTDTGATQINYLKHNPANATPVVVSDVAGQGETFFYWVSAYDTSGNESNLLAAQDGTIAPLSTFTPTGQIWGPATITGTQAAQMTMQEMHDSVGLTNGAVHLQNPNFAAGVVGWACDAGWSIIAYVNPVPGSSYVGSFTGTSTAAITNKQSIPCAPGNVIAASCYIGAISSSSNGQAILQIMWWNASGAQISQTNSPNAAVAPWTMYRAVGTAPAGTAYATVRVAVFGSALVSGWSVAGFTASLLANSVDEVPNGTTYVRTSTANVDPNTGAVTGFQGQGDLATVDKADTVNIMAGAVNSYVVFTSTVEVEMPAGTWTTVASHGIDTDGGYVKLRFSGYIYNTSASTAELSVIMYKGAPGSGTALWAIGNFEIPPWPGSGPPVIVIEWVDDTPAASQEYYVAMEPINVAMSVDNAVLTVENAKV